ncbi:MAG: DUF5309 family protein [Nitrospirota bacterium]
MANIIGAVLASAQAGAREDLDDKIFDASPYETPLLSSLPREDAKNQKHEWIEDQITALTDTINEGATFSASDTILTVSNGDRWTPNDIILCESEYMMITAVSGNNLTVIRGWGGSTAAIHADGSTLYKIGTAMIESADARSANTTTRSRAYNYTQIFEHTVQVSGTTYDCVWVGGQLWLTEVDKELKEHAREINRCLYWGRRVEPTSSARGGMGGLRQWITSEAINRNGTCTLQQYETFLRGIIENGGHPKVAMASALGLQAINGWSEGKLQTFGGDKQFGVAVGRLMTCFGEQEVILDSQDLNLGTDDYAGEIYALQMDLLAFSQLRKTKLEKLAKAGDYESGMIITECTLHRACEYAHGRLYNISGTA